MIILTKIATKVIGKTLIKSGIAQDVVKFADEAGELVIDGVRHFAQNNTSGLVEEGIELTMDVVEIGKDLITIGAEGAIDLTENILDTVDDVFGGITAFFGF